MRAGQDVPSRPREHQDAYPDPIPFRRTRAQKARRCAKQACPDGHAPPNEVDTDRRPEATGLDAAWRSCGDSDHASREAQLCWF